MNMTQEQLRELNEFCASDVMKWERIDCAPEDLLPGFFCICDGHVWIQTQDGLTTFEPTQAKHDAMEVLEKCCEAMDCKDVRIGCCEGSWFVRDVYRENPGARGKIFVHAMPPEKITLPLAICLFAQKLFTK